MEDPHPTDTGVHHMQLYSVASVPTVPTTVVGVCMGLLLFSWHPRRVIDINAGHHMAVLEVEKLGAENEAGRSERRQSRDIQATAGASIWAILEEIEGFCERDASSHSGCRSVGML